MSYSNSVQQAVRKLAPWALCNLKKAKMLALASCSYQVTEEVLLPGVPNEICGEKAPLARHSDAKRSVSMLTP